jgi:23S rRNA pseudouridine1911/1915/1917 synthase
MSKHTVETDDRADKALAKHFPEAGRRQLGELFDAGEVRVNGKRAKKGDRVVAGDVLELSREPVWGDALRAVADPNVALEILLETPELVAINKPAGVPSQPLRAAELGTIANGLAARFPECALLARAPRAEQNVASLRGDDVRDGGLVHRLDIGTSGVLVAARTEASYRALRDAFGTGGVAKTYLAICDALPVSRDCEEPLAQRGDHVVIDHTDGLSAKTTFSIERAGNQYALVRCTATTGRMHQVRAHLAHVGAPIAGDALYKGLPLDGFDGFFLHAATLEVAGHRIEAPLPERFVKALAAVGL